MDARTPLGLLIDVTRCEGCRRCVAECLRAHGLFGDTAVVMGLAPCGAGETCSSHPPRHERTLAGPAERELVEIALGRDATSAAAAAAARRTAHERMRERLAQEENDDDGRNRA